MYLNQNLSELFLSFFTLYTKDLSMSILMDQPVDQVDIGA